jgi:hypothetical protein
MITLTQLYNLGITEGVDLFDGLRLPEESPLDRETIVNVIMEKNGLNIPMYADPFVMKLAITIWSAKNQYTFIHVGNILTAEYSPIENTDRYDSITVSRERDMTDNTSISNDKDESATTTNHNTNTHGGRDTTNIEEQTSADNVDDYQPKDHTQTIADYNSTISDNGGGTMTKTTGVTGSNDKTVDEDETTTTTQHLHGNIGTTTNTQLISEEYRLLKEFNPYNFIADLFENELTLCLY